ncbi:TonB-dependent receptor [Flavobacterium wongokense]|uniref:TonB-dependent receptor n=1 Tax=Flavobacterium wongokense TaxID=2910674 RepID=UPI001F32B8C2|nr:TonB-dependent receptor [Flavobacterium sp. WG47]MCF6132959.1 TonB-dependent receptor [Flavobacterium sp. WG47]
MAQRGKAVIPLKNILTQISQQHQVKFNYLEDEIVVYAVAEPDQNWTLEQKIDYLKQETRLQFKLIDKKYYTIYNDKNLDKPLCGFLLDAETGQGIENAVISIDKMAISVFTNEKGYFELPKVSSDVIKVQHQSYQSFSINPVDLYVTGCPKFNLQSISQSLDEVVTQRYLATGISKEIDGSIVVKPKKFGILPGLIEPDVLQTMQQIPGIISIDETVSNINVRGGTHDQNLFLWNGIRMFQTGHFFGLISAFNPSLAQNISITKNGSSAFYGESVSSLVDISSFTNSVEKTNSSISANMISAEFYTKVKVSDKAKLTLSGRRSLTDFFESPTYKNYSDRVFQNTVITNLSTNEIVNYQNNLDFYFYDITAQYEQKIDARHELSIDLIAIENSLDFNQSTTDLNKMSDLRQENFGGSVQWKSNWNSKHFTEFEAYLSNYELNSLNETLESSQVLNQKNRVLDTGFRIKNSNTISKTLTLNTGYQFNETGVTNFDEINIPVFSRIITTVLRSNAGIVEGIYETEDKNTLLKAGLRANYFDRFKTFLLEPRVQFNQAFSPNLRLEILGERKSQTLSQVIDLQQDFLGIEKRRWTLADNEGIPIQKSLQVSMGMTFDKNNWLLTIDNFYKKVTGITTSGQGFLNQFESVKSTGSYTAIGAEFLVQKSFHRFYTWLSYSFNDNEYEFDSLNMTSFPNNYEITHAISWAGIYEWEKLKLALGAKWHSGRPITTPTSFTVSETNPVIVYNSPNNTKLKDYFQVNFSASKDWKLDSKVNLEAAVSILNLLNAKNSLNRFYRVNTTNFTVESVDISSLEMTPNVSVKVSF